MAPCGTGDADYVETLLVGNGPGALILSFVLHGNIPRYTGGHWDAWLDKKLRQNPDLLHISPDVFGHLQTSIKYSAQALPFNTLLDTLLRPKGDLSVDEDSCVKWHHEPHAARPHLVLGSAPRAGGQWADEPESTSYEIGTLSYAEQLSLPSYSFRDHWMATKGEAMPELIRPSRADCSAYYAAYPAAVGIEASFRSSTKVSGIRRLDDGFYVESHHLRCRNLVLASGIFNSTIEPPKSLLPLKCLDQPDAPLLVIGSGFTAADVIISAPPQRKIIHVFNWDPDNKPSPLRACHSVAYPEYAYIYKRMKLAAACSLQAKRPSATRMASMQKPPKPQERLPFFSTRNWDQSYEGYANAKVFVNSLRGALQPLEEQEHLKFRQRNGSASVEIRSPLPEQSSSREIGGFFYAAGRRGTLTFLEPSLLGQIVPPSPPRTPDPENGLPWADADASAHGIHSRSSSVGNSADVIPQHLISGHTLREKIIDGPDGTMDVEIAEDAFAIGSLTGDSLVRFAFGGCLLAAGKIMDRK